MKRMNGLLGAMLVLAVMFWAGGDSAEAKTKAPVGRIYGKIQIVTAFPDYKVQVVNASRDVGLVAFAVADSQTVQADVVRDEDDGVSLEVIGGVQRLDSQVAVHHELSREVDFI